jgi:hypothetical protein
MSPERSVTNHSGKTLETGLESFKSGKSQGKVRQKSGSPPSCAPRHRGRRVASKIARKVEQREGGDVRVREGEAEVRLEMTLGRIL